MYVWMDAWMQACKQATSKQQASKQASKRAREGGSERGREGANMHAEDKLEVALGLAMPTAKSELAEWKPLEAPQKGLGLLAPWRKLADAEDRKAANMTNSSTIISSIINLVFLLVVISLICIWRFTHCECFCPMPPDGSG